MTAGSLHPMMCLISSRPDLTLKSQCVMQVLLLVKSTPCSMYLSRRSRTLLFSRGVRKVRFCVVNAKGTASFSRRSFQERAVQWCSFAASLTSRCSLFLMILSSTVLVCTFSPHREIATIVIFAACSSHVLGGSSPHFSRHVARPSVSGQCLWWCWFVCLMLRILRWETEEYGVDSCSVSSCNFLLKLRLGMADDTDPLQYASHSQILSRMSFNCISQCTIGFIRQPQPVVRD